MTDPNVRRVAAWLALTLAGMLMSSDAGRPQPLVSVGFLSNRSAEQDASYAGFRRAFERLGGAAASRVRFQHNHIRIASDESMAQEVARAMAQGPTVMVASTALLASAAAAWATPRTAVVFSSRVDPVMMGIVRSLKASGRPVTGTSLDDALHDKRIELLRDASPGIRHVAVLSEAEWQRGSGDRTFVTTARRLGLTITVHFAEGADDIDAVIAQASRAGADAWYVPYSYLAYLTEPKIIERLERLGQPAIFGSPQAVSSGAAMSYWQDASFVHDALARLTWRVVQGEDPATIPIERQKRFVLEVRGDANATGLRVDPSLVRRADIVR